MNPSVFCRLCDASRKEWVIYGYILYGVTYVWVYIYTYKKKDIVIYETKTKDQISIFLFWEVSHGIEFIDTLVMRNLTCFRKSYICV